MGEMTLSSLKKEKPTGPKKSKEIDQGTGGASMEICPHCSHDIEPWEAVCRHCGAELPRRKVRVGQCIREGWQLFTKDAGNYVGYTLMLAASLTIPVINALTPILHAILIAGHYNVALRRLRGLPVTFGDVFIGWQQHFLPLLLTGLVTSVLITIGLILLVIPGLYLFVGYVFAIPFVIDKGLDFWSAMEASRKLVHRRWFNLFWLQLVLGGLSVLGAIPMGWGLLITVPLSMAVNTVAYTKLVQP
jgi:hypothetical protein